MRENIVRHIKNNRELYLAFFIPFLIMAAVCIAHGIYPFGNQCFLHIDMYHQYCPFTTEFFNKLHNGGSLMYPWNLGLGSDFVGLYAYYLASPMNWLLLFCPKGLVIEFMTLLILIKIGLCGFSFAYYLRSHFKTRSLSVVLFAVFYALSAFTCAYNWNIMWMDGIWLAPLVILGLERLVDEGKCGMYYIALSCSIFSNFYISVMLCIFLVIYYFILTIERKGKDFLHISLRFGLYSLLAGGTSAILLLPEIKILSVSGSGGISFPALIQWYYSVLSGMARSCINVEVIATTDHWPNIYCGCAVFVLFFLYLLNRNISWKKKLARFLFLAFFQISFANNILTFFWHGLDFPDGIPARQAYLYVFLMLAVCFETVHEAKGNTPVHILISSLLGLGLLTLFALFTDESVVTISSIVMTGILLLAYAVIYLFYIGKDKKFYRMGCIFACILVLTEATVNLDTTGVITTNRDTYTENLDNYENLIRYAEGENEDFFRVDKYNRLTKNESTLSGYRSASIFSTLININVADFYKELGMEGGKNYYCYSGATPFTAALFSVKYLMTDSALEDSPVRSLVDASGGMYLYENKYTLPLGFVVDPGVKERWNYKWGNGIEAQDSLCRELGASEPLFTETATTVETGKTTIHVSEDAYIVAYYSDKDAKSMTADYGVKTRKFTKCDHVYLLDLGWCTAGTDISLTSADTDLIKAQGYQMNLDTLNTAYDKLNETTMELLEFGDTYIEGSVELLEPGSLILSIPAEEGWKILVDGESVEADTFGDSLMLIPLGAGNHEISMKYRTPGLFAGAVVSGLCIVIFIGTVFWKRKLRKK